MVGGARFELGGLIFDAPAGELATRARTKRLEPKAAAVLAALCDERGSLVSRQALLDRCWGEGEGSDEALTQAVAQIRRAIEELGEQPGMVETLAKRGYRLREMEDAAHDAAPSQMLQARSGPSRWLIASMAAIVLLVAIWTLLPHGPRHAVKHALGMGPPAAGGH